jgi:hypothetical protein
METLKLFIVVKLLKKLQPKRNKAAFLCLQALGWSEKDIRWGLFTLNKVRISDLDKDVTKPTFYAILKGESVNEVGQRVIGKRLGVEKELLFQDAGTPKELAQAVNQ